MATGTKPNRQADPDVARIRAVKEAAKKLNAAAAAEKKALHRKLHAKNDLDGLINAAPEAQRAYLRSLIGQAGDEDEE
jgi:hypothetical protein